MKEIILLQNITVLAKMDVAWLSIVRMWWQSYGIWDMPNLDKDIHVPVRTASNIVILKSFDEEQEEG